MRTPKTAMKFLFSFLFVFQLLVVSTQAVTLDDVRKVLQQGYIDQISEEVLQLDSIDEITSKLDPYTTYFTKEEFTDFKNALNQEYVGIGILVGATDSGVTINHVYPGTPAEESGLKSGDIFQVINEKDVSSGTLEDVVTKIRGLESTTVTVTVKRPATDQLITKQITRKKIHLPTVISEKLAGNIGYMSITSFNQHTMPEVFAAIGDLHDVEGWIIDLRNNPGGYVDTAQELLGMFPQVKDAVLVEMRDSTMAFPSLPQLTTFNNQTIVLVNKQSASASEITAGALQDANAADIYGETTFGKGVMQTIHLFPEGDALKYTFARFYTPLGNAIHEVGIKPDVMTVTPLIDAHYEMLRETYSTYKQFEPLENVPVTKTFTIAFNTVVDAQSFTVDTAQLITLGGQEVAFTFKQKNDKEIEIIPNEPLQEATNYLLLLHPTWKSAKGIQGETGIMMEISTE